MLPDVWSLTDFSSQERKGSFLVKFYQKFDSSYRDGMQIKCPLAQFCERFCLFFFFFWSVRGWQHLVGCWHSKMNRKAGIPARGWRRWEHQDPSKKKICSRPVGCRSNNSIHLPFCSSHLSSQLLFLFFSHGWMDPILKHPTTFKTFLVSVYVCVLLRKRKRKTCQKLFLLYSFAPPPPKLCDPPPPPDQEKQPA